MSNIVVIVQQAVHPVLLTGVNITTPTLTPEDNEFYVLTGNLEPAEANQPLPFTYEWRVTGTSFVASRERAASFFENHGTREYTITVTDGNGNEFSDSITINP